MPGNHNPPTVETVPPTPSFPAEFPPEFAGDKKRRSDNNNNNNNNNNINSNPNRKTPAPERKARSSFSHHSSASSNSASDHKIRQQQDSFAPARRMTTTGASAGSSGLSPYSAPRRHSLQAALSRTSLHAHPMEKSPAPGHNDDGEEDDEPDCPTPEPSSTEASAFLPPPPAPDVDRAFVPQPERGRNRKPKPVSPSPLPRRRTSPDKGQTADDDVHLVHPKRQWEREQDGKQKVTSPTTDSSLSEPSPRSDASSRDQGEHETDRSSSPEHTTGYDEEKAKIEAQLKAAQATQARAMAAGMGMGMPGERLSMGVGGGMPAGGMGFGSVVGGGYPYPYALPGRMPAAAQGGGPLSQMQPPPSPHFQLQVPPPFGQMQMGHPQPRYDPSGGSMPPTPISDPQAYLNPMPPPQHLGGSNYSGTPQREYGPAATGAGSTLGVDSPERERQYGTPEMPRGNAVLPHIPPGALTPRPSHSPQVKHLPRGERLPLTGYELLATQLANDRRRGSMPSTTSSGKPGEPNQRHHQSLPPVYKRFTALNHRLLLTLQDELSELEEQLRRLDTNDTQIRRVPGGQILPASRRQDVSTSNELQWTRSNLIARIGAKMGVYNHILSTFQKTQALPPPPPQDVTSYRNFLNEKMPIADNEARFLDADWDLLSLSSLPQGGADDKDEWNGSTHPVSRRPSLVSQRPGSSSSMGPRPLLLRRKKSVEFQTFPPKLVPVLAAASALAVLLPVLTFLVIPAFVGRMTVVLLVAGGVSAGLIQGGVVGEVESTDMMVIAGVYGAVMAVVAAVVA